MAAKTRLLKLSSYNLVFFWHARNPPEIQLQSPSLKNLWLPVMLLVLPANQHVCQHREHRSKHFSPSHIKGGVAANRHYHPENVPSDFAHVLLMFCWPQSHQAWFVFEGILSPTHWSRKMQVRYAYEWKNLMGPEMTRIILSSVADRNDYGLCEERTVGLSGLKGIRWGVMNKINAIYLQNKR